MTTRRAGDGSNPIPQGCNPELIHACVSLITLYTQDQLVAVRPGSDASLVIIQTRQHVFAPQSPKVYQLLSSLLTSAGASSTTWVLFDIPFRTCRMTSFIEAREAIERGFDGPSSEDA
jgi:hypothetical protein